MTTRRFYANNAPQQTLSGSITSGALSCIIAGSFAGWPTQFPYFAALDLGTASFELVSVTNVVGTTATIVRGQDGTVAIAHPAGATLNQVFVRQDMDEANAHTSANAGVHGIAGNVVGTSDVQTLTNKTLAAPVLTGTTAGASETLSGTLTVTGATALNGGVTTTTVTASGAVSAASITGVAGQSVAVPGAVTMFAGSTAPTGWQLCDGSAINRTTFAALFAVVGTTYGAGDGSTTFNVPNLQDNFAVGKSGTKALGSTGGASTHQHTLSTAGRANIAMDSANVYLKQATFGSWTSTKNKPITGTTTAGGSALGDGAALDGVTDNATVLPPYVAMNFIIKT